MALVYHAFHALAVIYANIFNFLNALGEEAFFPFSLHFITAEILLVWLGFSILLVWLVFFFIQLEAPWNHSSAVSSLDQVEKLSHHQNIAQINYEP